MTSVAFRTAAIYLVVGFIWISLSDSFALSLSSDTQVLSILQSYKGLLFVVLSSGLIYFLVNRLNAAVEQAHERTSQAYRSTLESLLRAIELRDLDTQSHSQRVVSTVQAIAHAIGFPEAKMEALVQGALLHDIGKIGVPDEILRKPSELTAGEWALMRTHPERGYELLGSVEHLKNAATIALYHHERWDGSGYPKGLRETEIPLEARIFAVADVWDALTSPRPYRPAWDAEEAYRYVLDNSGILFDPDVVEVFSYLKLRGRV